MVEKALGPYKLLEQIGAGGMGDVYAAEDTRLGRKVAIKVLPARFAADPERLTRFEQEARAAAALNHPNIAVVHDIGAETGADEAIHFIVQEYLEGRSLRQRVDADPLSTSEALRVAVGIADGLAAAHAAGVVHRDLKPDNVFLTRDGQVKILDFGLAKLAESNPDDGSGSLSMSPTSLGTVAGQLMGTAAYMSPEQARGDIVDQRTDIWAFGVVLYEMLTGERLFRADSVSDTVAAVLRDDIDLASLPDDLPPGVRRALSRCLERDARRRAHHIADARIEIEDALAGAPADGTMSGPVAAGRSSAPPATPRPLWLQTLIAAGLIGVGMVIAMLMSRDARQGAAESITMRLPVRISPGMALDTGVGRAVAISPDGSRLAYVAGGRLYLRFLDRLEARTLAEDDASMPFFSPDGDWVGFFAGRELKKVSVSGGTPLTLTSARQPRGATWVGETIVYAPDTTEGLWKLAADGGADPEPLTVTAEGERSHRWPSRIDDDHVVFAAQTVGKTYGESAIKVVSVSDGTVREAQVAGAFPVYAASGHLLMVQGSTLFAAPFDVATPTVTGPISAVAEGVLAQSGGEQIDSGSAQYAIADNGTLVYFADGGVGDERTMFHVDAAGDRQPLPPEPRPYSSPRYSPDGRSVAVQISDESGSDVWVIDLQRGTQMRITSVGSGIVPTFSRDGELLAYASTTPGMPVANVFIGRVDDPSSHRQLTNESVNTMPMSFAPDGKSIAVMTVSNDNGYDIGVVNVNDGKITLLAASPAIEGAPEFSPDGRWIAFASDRTGRLEIHVMRPDGTGLRTVSTAGGNFPRWASDGSELYWQSANRVMAAHVDADGESFVNDRPRELFQTSYSGTSDFAAFDVDPRGGFLTLAAGTGADGAAAMQQVTMVFDFFRVLRTAYQ